MAVLSCSSSQEDISGAILYGRDFSQMYLPSESHETFSWLELPETSAEHAFLWIGDTVIFRGRANSSDHGRSRGFRDANWKVFKWTASGAKVSECAVFFNADSLLWPIDFNPLSLQVLCYSLQDTGVYHLVQVDSSLQLQDTISHFSLGESERTVWNLLLSYNGVICQIERESVLAYQLLGDSLGEATEICKGDLVAVSPDRTLVLCRIPTVTYQSLVVYNLISGKSAIVHQGEEYADACFSPDNRFVAYGLVDHGLLRKVHLRIFDLQHNKTISTPVTSAFPGPIWVKLSSEGD
ncbi:MAG: hypothetical protein IPH75_07405 [bacterium]|nr:hypothetical protein [bacterium]